MWSVQTWTVLGLVRACCLALLSGGVSVLARVTLDGARVVPVNIVKESLVLDCGFTVATPTEEVTQLTFYRKRSYDRRYKNIIQVPIPLVDGKRPLFRDSQLKRRSNVTLIKANYGRSVVRLMVKAECMDEATYRCEVSVNGGQAPPPHDIKVVIKEDPAAISLIQRGVVPEYHNAHFICSASVGKPEAEVSWLMTRQVGNQYENVTMGGMVTKRMGDRYCSPLAENTLIIEVTGNDEMIRCVVSRGQQVVYIEKPVEVQYPTRNTEIYSTVNGNKMAHWVRDISAFEGDQIVLNCSSRGRPEPHYTWRYTAGKGSNSEVNTPTLTGSMIHLSNATRNLTGIYQCVSANVVSGVNRDDQAEIRLTIKRKPKLTEDNVTPPTTTNQMDKIVAAVATTAVMVGLIATTICGKCCGG